MVSPGGLPPSKLVLVAIGNNRSKQAHKGCCRPAHTEEKDKHREKGKKEFYRPKVRLLRFPESQLLKEVMVLIDVTLVQLSCGDCDSTINWPIDTDLDSRLDVEDSASFLGTARRQNCLNSWRERSVRRVVVRARSLQT